MSREGPGTGSSWHECQRNMAGCQVHLRHACRGGSSVEGTRQPKREPLRVTLATSIRMRDSQQSVFIVTFLSGTRRGGSGFCATGGTWDRSKIQRKYLILRLLRLCRHHVVECEVDFDASGFQDCQWLLQGSSRSLAEVLLGARRAFRENAQHVRPNSV